jgi:hypothetical protein
VSLIIVPNLQYYLGRPTLPAPAACGTDLMANGMAWLADQLQAHASEPVVYQRGSEQVALCATFGSTLLKLDDGAGGIRMERTDRDFLIPAASLVLSGSPVLPKEGDKILHAYGSSLHTFQVLPYANEPQWRWSDPFRKMLRIHTKRISSEPL